MGQEFLPQRFFIFALFLILTALLGWAVWPVGGESPSFGQPAPDIAGGPWINSPPLTIGGLRGRVVLVEFWTYG